MLRCVLAWTLLFTWVRAQFDESRPCFCPQGESVESCVCDASDSLDDFNNREVYGKLQKLLKRDFFRFYKVNMEKPCPFWPDDRQCASKECGIEHCDDSVPAGLRQPVSITLVRGTPGRPPVLMAVSPASSMPPLPHTVSTPTIPTPLDSLHSSAIPIDHNQTSTTTVRRANGTSVQQRRDSAEQVDEKDESCTATQKGNEHSNAFDPLNREISDGKREQLRAMDTHDDDQSDRFCEMDDEDSSEMHYVDLSKNPERYTGYKGDGAVKIWKSIYQENCFKPNMKFDKNFLTHPNTFGLCLEKRVFYRLISALHSAITISIASYNYRPAPGGLGTGTWFRNVEMFANRFGTKWSWEGPQRLRNVYFAFLLELRALVKAAPYLQKELFYTGNEQEDAETRAAIEDFLETIKKFPHAFDETGMFTGVEAQARELREEFRQHFVNISRIMDCVGCDKCRLWGKVQTHGMGTALKILFSDLPHSLYKNNELGIPPFQLSRNEVVSLFQSFGRYSSSIREVDEFRREMGLGQR